jgi:hypothetical protein
VTNPSADSESTGHPDSASREASAALPPELAATPRDPAGSAGEDEAPLFPTMRNLPDMRRDAIEEAAETSPEARSRVARMNTDEATEDRSLTRRPSDVT